MFNLCLYFEVPPHHPLHCEQVLQHSNSGSSRPDEWILMRVRFPGSQTGHICLRFHLAIDDQEDARAGSGQITRVRASPRTSHRFGHLRSSSDISGHLGDNFTHRNIIGKKSKNTKPSITIKETMMTDKDSWAMVRRPQVTFLIYSPGISLAT